MNNSKVYINTTKCWVGLRTKLVSNKNNYNTSTGIVI